MSDQLSRRGFLSGGAAALVMGAGVREAHAQGAGYTIDTYPFRPDGVLTQIGFLQVDMDIGLLHPETGAPSIGFYAALDYNHGQPFGAAWKNTYRKFMKDMSVHDPDKGTMIMIANHIRVHAVPAKQIADAYYKAKNVWDARPDLRVAGAYGEPNGFDDLDVRFG